VRVVRSPRDQPAAHDLPHSARVVGGDADAQNRQWQPDDESRAGQPPRPPPIHGTRSTNGVTRVDDQLTVSAPTEGVKPVEGRLRPVPDTAAKRQAVRLAKTTAGVAKVVDKLTLVSQLDELGLSPRRRSRSGTSVP